MVVDKKKTHKLITTKGNTPRSKTRKLLQKFIHSNQKENVKNTLIFHHAMISEMNKSHTSGSNYIKKTIGQMAEGKNHEKI